MQIKKQNRSWYGKVFHVWYKCSLQYVALPEYPLKPQHPPKTNRHKKAARRLLNIADALSFSKLN